MAGVSAGFWWRAPDLQAAALDYPWHAWADILASLCELTNLSFSEVCKKYVLHFTV